MDITNLLIEYAQDIEDFRPKHFMDYKPPTLELQIKVRRQLVPTLSLTDKASITYDEVVGMTDKEEIQKALTEIDKVEDRVLLAIQYMVLTGAKEDRPSLDLVLRGLAKPTSYRDKIWEKGFNAGVD